MKSAKLPKNENLRIELLEKLEILDTESEATLDRVTKLASDLLGTPITLVSLVDKERQWFKSKQGLDAEETPREVAFCAHAILGDEVFVVEDATKDDRFFDNPLVTDAPNVIFYAGYPLEIEDGLKIGTLCAIDNKPKKFSKQEIDILCLLGKQVEDIIKTRYQLNQSTIFSSMLEELHKLDEKEDMPFDELATKALEIGAKVFQLDFGIISSVEQDVYIVNHCISPAGELVSGAEFSVAGTYCAEVIQREETVSYKEVGSINHLCEHPVYVNMKLESYISTPIWVDEKIFGTLNYSSKNIRKRQFTDEEKKFIEILAKMLGKKIKLQKQADNILRIENVLENAPEFVEMIDLKQDIISYTNKSLREVTGREVGANICLKASHPEWVFEILDKEAYPHAMNNNFWRGETAIYNTKKEEIPVLHTLMIEKDDQGNAIFASNIMRDISDRKAYEEQLKAQKAKAENATVAKSRFLANMSHEIRTPLYGISGTAEILNETKLDNDQKKYLKALINSSEHLTQIVNDILDLSKLDSDLFELSPTDFNFTDEIHMLKSMLNDKAKLKDIELNFKNEIENYWYKADNLRIRQVLINIIGNAIKFTEEGSVDIHFFGNENDIKIHIKDSGIGIPKDKLGLIFNDFSQVDDSYQKNFKGTGLGLAISKKIVEMMNGSLTVESEAGKGSTFIVQLPLAKGESLRLVQNEQSNISMDLSKHRILVVDDNQVNLLVITKFLKEFNPTIDIAKNGREALDKLQNNSYDVVFMDMQMPVLDGYSAVAEFRSWEKDHKKDHTYIVALSAYAFESEIQKSLDSGCDDYLSKPVKKGKLTEFLDNLFFKKAA